MIIDSSAVIEILLDGPKATALLEPMRDAPVMRIGAPTVLETAMVLTGRLGVPGQTLLKAFLGDAGMETVPFTVEHWPVAISAFTRFGKGRHPAALNFGDCLTYATAAVAQEPLLCVGEDFPKTDLALVV